jgi:hypothetical protein
MADHGAAFRRAQAAFDDNLKILGTQETDPVMWNLNSGLSTLVTTLRSAIADIQKQVVSVDSDVKSLR